MNGFYATLGAQPPTVRLYWDPNTEVDLTGYILSWGTTSGVYTGSLSLGKEATSVEAPCPSGTIQYFAIRAVNASGLMSPYSNEIKVTCGKSTNTKIVPRSIGNVVVAVVRRG